MVAEFSSISWGDTGGIFSGSTKRLALGFSITTHIKFRGCNHEPRVNCGKRFEKQTGEEGVALSKEVIPSIGCCIDGTSSSSWS